MLSDVPLFDRRQRGVRLNRRGWAYLKEVQRILAEVHGVSERQRRWPRRVRNTRSASWRTCSGTHRHPLPRSACG